MTDEVDALAETGAGADVAAPSGQYLVPARAPRRYPVRRSMLVALVELALTAALTAAGLHRSPALAAVLAYRLVNFWLILIAGWILMAVLAHRRSGPRTRAD